MLLSQKSSYVEAISPKILHPDKIEEKIQELRDKKLSIATLNGSFDLLHAGHLEMIYQAKQQADVLILALNSDSSIKQYKSSLRPIIPLEYRIQMIAALEMVDYISWFEEIDPRQILSRIQPDVHVNGAEYGKDCIEADTVTTYGGKIHIVELVPGLSTSTIIKKIVQTCA